MAAPPLHPSATPQEVEAWLNLTGLQALAPHVRALTSAQLIAASQEELLLALGTDPSSRLQALLLHRYLHAPVAHSITAQPVAVPDSGPTSSTPEFGYEGEFAQPRRISSRPSAALKRGVRRGTFRDDYTPRPESLVQWSVAAAVLVMLFQCPSRAHFRSCSAFMAVGLLRLVFSLIIGVFMWGNLVLLATTQPHGVNSFLYYVSVIGMNFMPAISTLLGWFAIRSDTTSALVERLTSSFGGYNSGVRAIAREVRLSILPLSALAAFSFFWAFVSYVIVGNNDGPSTGEMGEIVVTYLWPLMLFKYCAPAVHTGVLRLTLRAYTLEMRQLAKAFEHLVVAPSPDDAGAVAVVELVAQRVVEEFRRDYRVTGPAVQGKQLEQGMSVRLRSLAQQQQAGGGAGLGDVERGGLGLEGQEVSFRSPKQHLFSGPRTLMEELSQYGLGITATQAFVAAQRGINRFYQRRFEPFQGFIFIIFTMSAVIFISEFLFITLERPQVIGGESKPIVELIHVTCEWLVLMITCGFGFWSLGQANSEHIRLRRRLNRIIVLGSTADKTGILDVMATASYPFRLCGAFAVSSSFVVKAWYTIAVTGLMACLRLVRSVLG